MTYLKENLCYLRDKNSLSWDEMAERLGINTVSIYRWLHAKHIPTPNKLIKLSNEFKVSVNHLTNHELEYLTKEEIEQDYKDNYEIEIPLVEPIILEEPKEPPTLYERLRKRIILESINAQINITNVLEIIDQELNKPPQSTNYQTIEELEEAFNHVFNFQNVLKRGRKRQRVAIRQYFFYMAKKTFSTKYSLKQLGEYIGRESPYDHTTVIYAIKKINDQLQIKDPLTIEIHNKFSKFTQNKFGL